MNFARDVVDAADPAGLALVELARDGTRREWCFGEVADAAARLAGTFARCGVGRGDVVMTVIGNRPEWVLTMVACFRIGAVVLPCTEQLRARDLRLRLDAARPALVLLRRAQRGRAGGGETRLPRDPRSRRDVVQGSAGRRRSSWPRRSRA